MSHLPASRQEGKRTSRKPVVTSPRQPQKPVKRLNQRDMDSSCHRLSRVPQKFTANKAIQNEKQEPYAVAYFKNNPDARDSSPPDQKLERYDDKLKGDLEVSERFTTLVQQKALRYIVFGENSVEALESHAAIGKFYNENHRPASALRHLNKARQLEETNEIDQPLSIEIAVETGEAHLALRNEKKAESAKHVSQANSVIARYAETQIDDARMRYRRDMVKARVASGKEDFEKAIEMYETAWMSLDEANGGEEKEETAVLFQELAECCEAEGKRKKAGDNYKKAYDIYRNVGCDEAADAIEPKLPKEGEEYEEEWNERNIDDQNESSSSSHSEQEHVSSDKEDEPAEEEKKSSSSEKKRPSSSSSSSSEKAASDHHSDEETKEPSEDEHHSESDHHSDEHHSEEHHSEEGIQLSGDEKWSDDEEKKKSSSSSSSSDHEKARSDHSDALDEGGFDDEEEKPKLSDTGGFDDDDFEEKHKSSSDTEEKEKLSDTGGFDDDFEGGDEF